MLHVLRELNESVEVPPVCLVFQQALNEISQLRMPDASKRGTCSPLLALDGEPDAIGLTDPQEKGYFGIDGPQVIENHAGDHDDEAWDGGGFASSITTKQEEDVDEAGLLVGPSALQASEALDEPVLDSDAEAGEQSCCSITEASRSAPSAFAAHKAADVPLYAHLRGARRRAA